MNIKLFGLALALLELAAGDTIAKEGNDQYPNGAENWLAGAAPSPGNHFLNYLGHYNGTLHNGDGDKAAAAVSAWFNAFRLIHITEMRILGGNYGVHIIVPIVHQRMKLGDHASSVVGLGDITISPASLVWHLGNWHWVAALDIRMPTGQYKAGDPRKSIGTNYWSI